ncbi:hypothetical protein M885DRAFT_553283 [Pelagophyceae sp. CCMP2097]|nr:hypothetical protein M885DRAFT_553283 [Pelagophyceae sp. CCMP2097]
MLADWEVAVALLAGQAVVGYSSGVWSPRLWRLALASVGVSLAVGLALYAHVCRAVFGREPRWTPRALWRFFRATRPLELAWRGCTVSLRVAAPDVFVVGEAHCGAAALAALLRLHGGAAGPFSFWRAGNGDGASSSYFEGHYLGVVDARFYALCWPLRAQLFVEARLRRRRPVLVDCAECLSAPGAAALTFGANPDAAVVVCLRPPAQQHAAFWQGELRKMRWGSDALGLSRWWRPDYPPPTFRAALDLSRSPAVAAAYLRAERAQPGGRRRRPDHDADDAARSGGAPRDVLETEWAEAFTLYPAEDAETLAAVVVKVPGITLRELMHMHARGRAAVFFDGNAAALLAAVAPHGLFRFPGGDADKPASEDGDADGPGGAPRASRANVARPGGALAAFDAMGHYARSIRRWLDAFGFESVAAAEDAFTFVDFERLRIDADSVLDDLAPAFPELRTRRGPVAPPYVDEPPAPPGLEPTNDELIELKAHYAGANAHLEELLGRKLHW